MTITHLSHFGLEKIGDTNDSIIFAGSLAACRRMAFAHGLEVDRYEGSIVSSDSGFATYTTATPESFSFCYFKQGGFICKARDGYSLLIRKEDWND